MNNNPFGANMSGGLSGMFDRFMQQFRGQNPQSIINELVRSGRISQAQLDTAQEQARRMNDMFASLRSKYNL